MSYETIKYEFAEKILTITLNRPEKLNAFNATMQRELIDAFDRADEDDEIRAIIVTGEGRAFCAGADLSSGANTFDRDARHGPVKRFADGKVDYSDPNVRDGGGQVTLRIFKSLKPVIAAVNGPAVGIGVTMQLAMDIRVASEAARFGFVFSQRGIVPEAASSWFLPRIVGIAQALEWCYTGRVFPAGQQGGPARSAPADRAGAGPRDRREDGAGVDRADPPDDVAHDGRGRSHGGPQGRQPRHLHARPF
jgi:enoyl-CoA hydratase/carnithine racemase